VESSILPTATSLISNIFTRVSREMPRSRSPRMVVARQRAPALKG
jgi:hypothetical protein